MRSLPTCATVIEVFAMAAVPAETPPPEDSALGKPHTLAPAPDCGHCTDPDDAKLLTDGAYTKGRFA